MKSIIHILTALVLILTFSNDDVAYNVANNKNISNIPNEEIDNYQWTKLEEIDKALEDFTWYDKKIFELYYYEVGNTLDSLAAKTRISRNSLFRLELHLPNARRNIG